MALPCGFPTLCGRQIFLTGRTSPSGRCPLLLTVVGNVQGGVARFRRKCAMTVWTVQNWLVEEVCSKITHPPMRRLTTVKLKVLEAPSVKELIVEINAALTEGWSLRGDTRSFETYNASRTQVVGCVFTQVMAWVCMLEANEQPTTPSE